MIEVFKTNVTEPEQAKMLLEKIQEAFEGYIANFDLEDCDQILRVKSTSGVIQSSALVNLLKRQGVHAEILPDEPGIAYAKEICHPDGYRGDRIPITIGRELNKQEVIS